MDSYDGLLDDMISATNRIDKLLSQAEIVSKRMQDTNNFLDELYEIIAKSQINKTTRRDTDETAELVIHHAVRLLESGIQWHNMASILCKIESLPGERQIRTYLKRHENTILSKKRK